MDSDEDTTAREWTLLMVHHLCKSAGAQPLVDGGRAGVAARLDAVAALAGRAADLAAEAAALRLRFPSLSKLAWVPAASAGAAAVGRLRLGFLCLATGARLQADLAIGEIVTDHAVA